MVKWKEEGRREGVGGIDRGRKEGKGWWAAGEGRGMLGGERKERMKGMEKFVVWIYEGGKGLLGW